METSIGRQESHTIGSLETFLVEWKHAEEAAEAEAERALKPS